MGIVEGIINFLDRLGGKTLEVVEIPTRRISTEGMSIRERLELLKKMREEIEKEKESEEEKLIEDTIEWREKTLRHISLSERIADGVLKYLKGPVSSLSSSIKGLDIDLYRANINMSRERYVALMLGVAILVGIFSFAFSLILYLPIDISILVSLLGFIGGFWYMRYYPRVVWRRRVAEVEKALPYVLRHIASLLSAGIGIAEAFVSVAKADYGVISEEFYLIVQDMHKGASFEDALSKFEMKMASENVTRVTKQILRAIKFGGNLADILYKMADEFAFEYRLKLMEYVQKINGLSFVYMFLSVIMPTLFIVVILAGSILSRTLVISIPGLVAIMLFAFPMLSLIMITMIKRAEPR